MSNIYYYVVTDGENRGVYADREDLLSKYTGLETPMVRIFTDRAKAEAWYQNHLVLGKKGVCAQRAENNRLNVRGTLGSDNPVHVQLSHSFEETSETVDSESECVWSDSDDDPVSHGIEGIADLVSLANAKIPSPSPHNIYVYTYGHAHFDSLTMYACYIDDDDNNCITNIKGQINPNIRNALNIPSHVTLGSPSVELIGIITLFQCIYNNYHSTHPLTVCIRTTNSWIEKCITYSIKASKPHTKKLLKYVKSYIHKLAEKNVHCKAELVDVGRVPVGESDNSIKNTLDVINNAESSDWAIFLEYIKNLL